jgi:hypothetical protein
LLTYFNPIAKYNHDRLFLKMHKVQIIRDAIIDPIGLP